MEYLKVFIVGGSICMIGQLLMDKTKLLPAHILVLFVCSGVVLTALGVYEPLVEMGGAGATVPLPGFGYALAKGVMKGVEEAGLIGAFSGALEASSLGIGAAVIFGFIMAVLFNPKG